MLTRPPKCRVVCKDEPGEVMDQLIAAFTKLRAQGLSEKDALALSHDPLRLAGLFPGGSLGSLPATAQAFASSGCAECAVNKAYSPDPAGS
jgi:hypothetical protein